MKLSTRMRYGMRALCDLAAHYPEQVSLQQIALREEISMKYLEQIMARLRTAGLVRASTGMHGGYALTRDPERVKASEAYRALEGSPMLVFCLEQNAECARMRRCPTRCLWRSVSDAMIGVMDETSLADLIQRHGRGGNAKPVRKGVKPARRSAARE